MTVKELMLKLSTCNPDAKVILYCREAEESNFAGRVVEATLGDTDNDDRWYVKGDWADYGMKSGPAIIIG